jgi:EmrB/QacA subfamily drug resistance transporter
MPLLLAVALGILLNPLNSSMISVALAQMQDDLQLSFADATWLISSYYLASAIGQPVMGKLSDTLGRKRLFIIGLILVAIASALAPLAPNFGWLICFRIIQAVGSSTLYPAGMGAIRKYITTKQAQSLGIINVFASTSAAFGPSIGGFLIHYGNWHAIFLINFPFIIASLILTIKVFPKDEKSIGKAALPDVGGILLFSGAIVTMLIFFLSVQKNINWFVLAASILAAVLFCLYEVRRKEPFIDIRSLRRNKNVSYVYIQYVLINVLFYSIFFGVPAYLQQELKYGAELTGIMMLAVAGFGVVVSPFAGRWIDRTGSSRSIVLAGSVTAIVGTVLLLGMNSSSPPIYIFAVLSILGCSNGLNNLGLQTALYSFVKSEDTGAAFGLFMTSRYLGTILSSSLLGIVFGQHATTEQFHIVALVGAAIGCIILLLSIRMPEGQIVNSKNH